MPRIARWQLQIQQFDFDIEHRSRKFQKSILNIQENYWFAKTFKFVGK